MTLPAKEQSASDAAHLLSLAQEAGDVGTWRWHADCDQVFVCERTLRHMGLVTSSPISLAQFVSAVHADDRLHVESCLRHSVSGHGSDSRTVEFRIIDPGSSIRWICTKWKAISDASGSDPYIVGTTFDVTIFRDNREVIRRTESTIRNLGDNLPNGAIYQIVSEPPEQARFTYISAGIERLFGVSQEEVLRDPEILYRLVHPEDQERLRKTEARAVHGLTTYECQFRQFTKSGEQRWVMCRAAPLRTSPTKVTWDGVIIDITEEKRTEELLRTSEATFRALADTMPQIVWSCNAEGAYDYFNRRWYEFSGARASDEVSDAGFLDHVHPDDRPKVIEGWTDSLRSGEPFQGEYRLQGNGNEYRWFIVRASPLRDDSGAVVRWFGTCTDIHSERQSRDELVRAKVRAEDEGKVKDEFLATLSHELRTPLNSILGWSQLMRQTNMSEEDIRKGIDIIERSARVQIGLIEDLLDMSRIIAGKLRLDVQRVSMAAVIQSAITSAHPTAIAKEIAISQQLDTPDVSVRGDPGRIQQVIWNLLANALKFTPRGGKVWVTLSRLEEWVQIEVRDTGIGISDQFLPYVFDRFRQSDASTTRKYDGLGIGLSIVRSLVELHGGSVTARSAGAGRGALFCVRLPAPRSDSNTDDLGQAHESSVPRRIGPARDTLRGLRVLVVDDDRDARDVLQAILEGDGAEVVIAASVNEACAILAKEIVDVVLTDIGMPEKDGYALMRELKSWTPPRKAPPAVALTAFARSEDRTRALVAGFQHHLPKPVEPAELVAVVSNLGRRDLAA